MYAHKIYIYITNTIAQRKMFPVFNTPAPSHCEDKTFLEKRVSVMRLEHTLGGNLQVLGKVHDAVDLNRISGNKIAT